MHASRHYGLYLASSHSVSCDGAKRCDRLQQSTSWGRLSHESSGEKKQPGEKRGRAKGSRHNRGLSSSGGAGQTHALRKRVAESISACFHETPVRLPLWFVVFFSSVSDDSSDKRTDENTSAVPSAREFSALSTHVSTPLFHHLSFLSQRNLPAFPSVFLLLLSRNGIASKTLPVPYLAVSAYHGEGGDRAVFVQRAHVTSGAPRRLSARFRTAEHSRRALLLQKRASSALTANRRCGNPVRQAATSMDAINRAVAGRGMHVR